MARATLETSRFICPSGSRKQHSSWLSTSIPNRFSELEIKARVSDVLAYVLNHVWEAARVAGAPLPCLEDQTADREEDEDL
jgi:hypothetical protein